MIPLVDLHAQYLSIKDEIDNAVRDCIDNAHFIKGEAVTDFEERFAGYTGIKHCVSCANGTDALEMILKALGIGPGDEVIVPALSWISTAECVNNVGAEPVFADVKPDTYTIDPAKFPALLTSRTKAVIPVHLYGMPADMDEIMSFAEAHKLFVVEDCAQAHGALYKGRKAGTLGTASAFSFFPTKNLGAFGDAGAVVTDDGEVAEKVRKLANHGQLYKKHVHEFTGRNSRLDTIQAAVLRVKLKYLDKWNDSRIMLAHEYLSALRDTKDIVLPSLPADRKPVYHLFAVRAIRRNDLIALLDKNNIGWSVHYPSPLPFLDAYKYKNHQKDEFPSAAITCSEICSLPIYPGLDPESVQSICEIINRSY